MSLAEHLMACTNDNVGQPRRNEREDPFSMCLPQVSM